MISKEQIDNCKEAVYTYCVNKKYCVLCALNEQHIDHDIRVGTLKIGPLENLLKVLDSVMHDTTPSRFRLSEAGSYLESQGYIQIVSKGVLNTCFFATPKLMEEMKVLINKPKIEEWY